MSFQYRHDKKGYSSFPKDLTCFIYVKLQVTVLEDQIEGQARKVGDLEKQLKTKKEECCKFEEMVGKERSEKSNLELRNGELKTEYANLKLKCARLERDLVEYRLHFDSIILLKDVHSIFIL